MTGPTPQCRLPSRSRREWYWGLARGRIISYIAITFRPAIWAMWLPRRFPGLHAGRQFLAVVAVVAHVLAAVGAPLPGHISGSGGKASDIPFPCQAKRCGCLTSAQCWAGACCCHTMREKIAWAAEHGVTPPTHAVRLAAAEAPPNKPASGASDNHNTCPKCQQPQTTQPSHSIRPPNERSVVWMSGMSAQKCRGQGPAGVMAQAPAVPPDHPVMATDDSVLVGVVCSSDTCPDQITYPPASPPPIA